MTEAIRYFLAYVRALLIDFFAFPIEKSDGLYIAIVSPENIVDAMKAKNRLFYKRRGERFARFRRAYSPIIVCPALHPVAQIKTQYKKLADIPPHCDSIARGFEIVVAEYTNGIHRGDNLHSYDVDSSIYGHIEVKTGEGMLKRP